MKILRRGVFCIPLVALVITSSLILAQDNTATVVGSNIVLPVVAEVAKSASDVALSVNTTGTVDGFVQFCANQADSIAASRAMSQGEELNCVDNGVQFEELLVAQNILVFIGNTADSFNACLTATNLNTIFQPSANGNILNWNQVNTDYADLALTTFVPEVNTLNNVSLDNLVNGTGLRADATTLAPAAIVDNVASTPGAIGVVPYEVAILNATRVSILAVDNQTGQNGCVTPSPDNYEGKFYTLGDSFYLYVNKNAATKLKSLLDLLANPLTAQTINGLGYTAPTSVSYEFNRQSVAGETVGRVFTKIPETFNIPAGLAGQVNFGGLGALNSFLKATADSFAQTQQDLKFNLKFDGEPAGLRRFCNGEIDMVVTAASLSGDAKTNCDANNVKTYDIPFGNKTVVLVANVADTYNACLTTDQISTIWGVASTKTLTTWQSVGDGFPDTAITLFAPALGSDLTDILLFRAGQITQPQRTDVTEANDDPLYRAAATANVSGALTYISWLDYQKVLTNNQANIRLVSVDAGKGCVVPSDASISDATYPLNTTATLLINYKSLGSINVQVYLWTLFDSANYAAYRATGFSGISEKQFAAIRSALLKEFSVATAALNASPEVTAEPNAEATAEVTADANVEMPAETTVEATVAMTAEATVEVTETVAPSATTVPTQKPTETTAPTATTVPTEKPTSTTVPTVVPTTKPTQVPPTAEATATP